jgi:mono/diheme cytochrome c family protein
MRRLVFAGALATSFLAPSLLTRARQPEAESPTRSGARLYAAYCASCHGVDGKGDGPLVQVLVAKPANLTRLAERYGSPLPVDPLAAFIDGRRDVKAHGPREMPVWGEQLYRGEPGKSPPPDSPSGSVREAARRGTIELIIAYLDTIQAPPSGPSAPP